MNLESAVQKIRRFFRKNKRLPSYQEMCRLFGFASKHASFKLAAKLIEAGILGKDDKGRLIPDRLLPSLPVLGIIRAGSPTAADEQILSSVSFDDYLVAKPEKSYLLRVSGDSMIEAGIQEGDVVIVEKDREPKEGDIVVASIDGEFTLKYFRKRDNLVFLAPGNSKYSPLFPAENLTLFGIVISVVRKYH